MNVTARIIRTGGWWAVEVPEVDGAFTQAKRLDQVPAMVADAVSLLAGVPAEQVRVTVEVAMADEARHDWEQAAALQAEAQQLQARAAAQARSVVKGLRAQGLSVRDVGQLLDVSPGRVSQLEHA